MIIYINVNFETKDRVKKRNEQLIILYNDVLDKCMETFDIEHTLYMYDYFRNIIENYIKDYKTIVDNSTANNYIFNTSYNKSEIDYLSDKND